MSKRPIGVIDCTIGRLPEAARKVFDSYCMNWRRENSEIRRFMVSEGFRLNPRSIYTHRLALRRAEFGRGQRGRLPEKASVPDLSDHELEIIDELLRIPGMSPTLIFRQRKLGDLGIKSDTFLRHCAKRRRSMGVAPSSRGPRAVEKRAYQFALAFREALTLVVDQRFVDYFSKALWEIYLARMDGKKR